MTRQIVNKFPGVQILKGVAFRSGDGWKDQSVRGEVVYVWNRELPDPYAEGQFPRVGNSGWSASTSMFDFTPCSVEEAETMFAIKIEDQVIKANLEAASRLEGATHLLTERVYSVSYNDSYFGEQSGALKTALHSIERLITSLKNEPIRSAANQKGVIR